MVPRFAGAGLGFFAFTVAVVAGLFAGNPPTTVLSRGILSLFLFFIIGLVIGQAAQSIILEHQEARNSEIERQYREGDSTNVNSERPSTGERTVAEVS